MQNYGCKCGDLQGWGSMSPPACHGCPVCGTRPKWDQDPGPHQSPQPHDYSATIEQRSVDGPITVPVCRYCSRTQWEIEHGDG